MLSVIIKGTRKRVATVKGSLKEYFRYASPGGRWGGV